jgi:4'-phosphopantetheinyl transferase EntD
MIEEILPDSVAAAEAFGEGPVGARLFPCEEKVIARAVEKRRREFTDARACARRALGRLGIPPLPIPTGDKGAPQWPAGIVGAITHCTGYRAAAVARTTVMHTIGIDAEPHGPLPDGVLEHIARPEELTQLPRLHAATPDICWDRLLFSAKESIYKAWFPLAQRWLGFEDAVVTLDHHGGFVANLLVPAPPQLRTSLHGRWIVRNGLVVTALTLPRGDTEVALPGSPPDRATLS